MARRPPITTRTATLFPSTTLFRSLATGGIHAVSAPPKINLVQIKLKDLLLGEFAFQGQRQNHFPELAGEAVAVVEKYVAGDLLRNCGGRSEEHTSELQSLMRIAYAVFCLQKTKK